MPSAVGRVFVAGLPAQSGGSQERERVERLLESIGIELYDGWNGLAWHDEPAALLAIAASRIGELGRCGAVLAFEGTNGLDGGTASIVGFASALDIPVVCFSRSRPASQRVALDLPLAYFVIRSGGRVVTTAVDAAHELATVFRLATGSPDRPKPA